MVRAAGQTMTSVSASSFSGFLFSEPISLHLFDFAAQTNPIKHFIRGGPYELKMSQDINPGSAIKEHYRKKLTIRLLLFPGMSFCFFDKWYAPFVSNECRLRQKFGGALQITHSSLKLNSTGAYLTFFPPFLYLAIDITQFGQYRIPETA